MAEKFYCKWCGQANIEAFLSNLNVQVNENFSKVSNFVAAMGQFHALDRALPLIASVRHEHFKLQEEIRKWKEKWENDNSFNFFDNLTEGYLNEVNHSRILAKFLNPKTRWPEPINPNSAAFLNIFVGLLSAINPNIEHISFTNDVAVLWEDGLDLGGLMPNKEIDFYIEEKNRCIIVENKITGRAGDQPYQLGRYFKSAREKKKDIIAIVYLPLFYKEIPSDNYEFIKKHIGGAACVEFRKKLVVLPAMDTNRNIVEDFFVKCVDLAKSYKGYTAAVCMEQYSQLIKRNGGIEKMAEELRHEFLKKVLSERDSAGIVADIYDVWAIRHNLLAGDFKAALERQLSFHNEPVCGGTYFIGDISDDVFMYFHQPSNYSYQIGFGSKAENLTTVQNDLIAILRRPEFTGLGSVKPEGTTWVYADFDVKDIGGSFPDMVKNLVDYYRSMKTEAEKVLRKCPSQSAP